MTRTITREMVHSAIRYASHTPGDVNWNIARYLNAELGPETAFLEEHPKGSWTILFWLCVGAAVLSFGCMLGAIWAGDELIAAISFVIAAGAMAIGWRKA